jgi:hypothetical protein
VACLLLAGCGGWLHEVAADLNARQVTSCGRVSGAYGPFAAASVVWATGGATLADCWGMR